MNSLSLCFLPDQPVPIIKDFPICEILPLSLFWVEHRTRITDQSSLDLNKNGDFEKLKFPTFHKELLLQNYWNPGDDLGRIKVVIAEGFSRDNMTYPFERIKNIVSFSFQHAPLGELNVHCNSSLEMSFIAREYFLTAPVQMSWRPLVLLGQMLLCGAKYLFLRPTSHNKFHQSRAVMESKLTVIRPAMGLPLYNLHRQLPALARSIPQMS